MKIGKWSPSVRKTNLVSIRSAFITRNKNKTASFIISVCHNSFILEVKLYPNFQHRFLKARMLIIYLHYTMEILFSKNDLSTPF